ncbi:hypothetical protein ACOSQ2_019035 [Xanthoceras sorbifolium]
MLNADEDSLMKEIEGYMGSTSSSGESTDSESHPLSRQYSEEHMKLIHSVDPAERNWKKLLCEEILRPSQLWSRVELNSEGTPFPRFKDLIAYAWVRHDFEIFCRTQFLTPISEVERKFASDSMSNLKVTILSVEEVLKKRREKTAASAQKRKQPSVAKPDLATFKHAKKNQHLCIYLKKKKHSI